MLAADTLAVCDRCDVREPLAELVNGVAARVADGQAVATPTLRAAVTRAGADHAQLQTVAGRHVHVVYFDTVLAAGGRPRRSRLG